MMNKLFYYNQRNYSNVDYSKPDGTKATVASGGCGVCSACMVFNTLAGKELYTVKQMAAFSKKNSARNNYGTVMPTLLNALCKANNGFSWIGTSDVNKLVNHLKNGGMAICNQGNAYNVFSTGGHFVVAYEMSGKNIEVADPSMYAGKYDAYKRPERIVKKTEYGCIITPEEMKKATQDRSPSYYLVSYKHIPTIEKGKRYEFTIRPYCYKKRDKDSKYTVAELTKLSNDVPARLKKGKKVKVKNVYMVGKDIWIEYRFNMHTVYSVAYDYEKDKTYVK